jgi:WD40 repeat protein
VRGGGGGGNFLTRTCFVLHRRVHPGHSICRMSGHEAVLPCHHCAGRHLASGGYDHTVRLYDVNRGGTAVKLFEGGHSALVSRVVFSPHGKLLISGSKDGTIRMWDVISVSEPLRSPPTWSF